MKNKKVLIATAVVGVAGAIGMGATPLADSSGTNSTNEPNGLVQKIADTFHLNKTDVQKVFDDYHQQNMADRHQKLVDRLDQAVKDGKITEDQKTKIIAKLDELHKQFQGESKQDRHANRQQLHDELQQWAKDNGIDLDQILPQGLGQHEAPDSNN